MSSSQNRTYTLTVVELFSATVDVTVKEEEPEPAPTAKRRRVTRKNSASAATVPTLDAVAEALEAEDEGKSDDDAQKSDAGTAPKRECPAVLEERAGLIEFRVVSNDNTPESLIILTGLKNIFQRQLPKMPGEYHAMAIVNRGLQVVGGITYRPFYGRKFAEIVFCAITNSEQVNITIIHDKFTSPIMRFLTYANNYAIGYFKKQGFTKEITLDRSIWTGASRPPKSSSSIRSDKYPNRQISKSHVVHRGRDVFRERDRERERKKHQILTGRLASSEIDQKIIEDEAPIKLDATQVPGLAEFGWTPEMDELSRKPKRGPHHNLMRHVLIEMDNHASSWPFLNPVNGEEMPDYYDVIKSPMGECTR
ncbi:hypothetical protein V8E36_008806 [Tilletia maclaganii]